MTVQSSSSFMSKVAVSKPGRSELWVNHYNCINVVLLVMNNQSGRFAIGTFFH
jgi:hypothetical protein